MTRSHVALAAAVAAAGLLLGSCGSTASGTPVPPAVADASGVDMCTILTDAELTALGIEPDTREPMDLLGVIGCGWLGQPITLSLGRNDETVAEYVNRRDDPAFTSFRENTVNGRSGVQLSVESDRTDCAQMVDGGSVSLRVAVAPAFSLEPRPIYSCAEALRIAEMIEPRLPQGEQ
ncbi:MAG: DUF3558 domain-containing protein [Pseudonocardiaceae bacterium]